MRMRSHQRSLFLSTLRQSRWLAPVGVWLMMFQVLFAAEHLSAQAAATASPWSTGVGFLEICHSEPDVSGEPQSDRAFQPKDCTLCASAAAAGSALSPDAAGVVAVLPAPQAEPARAIEHWPQVRPFRIHYGAERGPPLSLQS